MKIVLAFDLGASSGRALLGTLSEGKLQVEEIHRFSNDPVQAGKHLYWDVLRLYHEIKQAILKTKHRGNIPDSIGIDSWGVDYCLLGSTGELLGNSYHYRDRRTDGVMEEVFAFLPKEEIFQRTGIQFMPFNTMYQLYSQKKQHQQIISAARHFLMIPATIRYFLTGQVCNEFSHVTTTQLYNPVSNDWDNELLDRLGLPRQLFGTIVEPGTIVGQLQTSVCEELGVPPIPVVAVAEHDTGSAVAAVPALDKDFVYVSSGTWSLMGTEIEEALITEQTAQLDFTNEGGVNHTYRLLKNITGLWLLQECQRTWEKAGSSFTFRQLVEMASTAAPFRSYIDPDDAAFLNPVNMVTSIQDYCRQRRQPIPQTPGEITRCILESLALKYRYVFERIQRLTGKEYARLHLVGGGSHNQLLCQCTANAIGKPVWVGPSEASGIGNILVQFIALGEIGDISEAREIVRRSFSLKVYEPEQQDAWEEAYLSFLHHTGLKKHEQERG